MFDLLLSTVDDHTLSYEDMTLIKMFFVIQFDQVEHTSNSMDTTFDCIKTNLFHTTSKLQSMHQNVGTINFDYKLVLCFLISCF